MGSKLPNGNLNDGQLTPMVKRALETFVCPNCGAEVPVVAMACPDCGSDEQTGWSEDVIYDGLDLSDPEADEEKTSGSSRRSAFTALVIVVLISVLLLLLLGVW